MNLKAFLLVPAIAVLAYARPLQAQSIPVSAALEDFDVLWKSIKEAHGGLHRFVTAADLDRKIAAHRLKLDKPITVVGLSGIISESLAELRDGHARLEFDSVTSVALASAALLPLRVAIEDERVVVTSNDSPADTTIRPGMEVVSINGHATSDLVRSLLPMISGDGFIETGKRASLSRDFAPRYWLYVEQVGSYRVVARNRQRTVTAALPGILERNRRQVTNPVNATFTANLARLDGPRGNVALEFIGDGSVARLRVRAFDGQAFIERLDSAFRTLRDRGTRSLVLDLRGNGGGVDLEGAMLVSYFVERPFRYFDYIHLRSIAPSFATWQQRTFESTRAGTVPHPAGGFRVTSDLHRGVSEQQPGGTPFTGKLVVLIDGGTFSTAADVAAQLRSLGRATFVGEETAGGYEGNTSGLNASIILPNSRLRLRIMMYDYWNAVKPPPAPGRGTIPDHVVVRRVSDILRGADPAMARALELLR